MKQSTKDAYAEVDAILNLMDDKYTKLIPKKVRTMIKANKTKNYYKKIEYNVPLAEQNLSDESISLLAALYYNYWCKDEKKKKELLEVYFDNERKDKKESEKKGNLDNSIESVSENVKQEMLSLIIYKDPKWYYKIFNKFLSVFKHKKNKY